jgi:hypothetical protein
MRETEALTITVYGQDEGSYLDFSGVASPQVAKAVNLAIDRLVNGVAMATPQSRSRPPLIQPLRSAPTSSASSGKPSTRTGVS